MYGHILYLGMNLQISLFDEGRRLYELSKLGDPLEKLNRIIDWEMFLPIISEAFERESKGVGGRPPYPHLLMFKILILQRLYGLSDDQTEFMIRDRMTFMRFLGITLSDRVPDAKTIWLFRDTLVNSGTDIAKRLFDMFEGLLESKGIISRSGSMVDATFIEAPRQRNTREENQQIKEGKIPEEWKKPECVHKLRQKDTDARWAKKDKVTHYGYKDEAMVDAESKLIMNYAVMTANVHDIKKFEELIDPSKDKVIYGDSAFISADIEARVKEKSKANTKAGEKETTIEFRINEKGRRNNPLTDEQKASNKIKSSVRCRVEHVFGYFVTSMSGKRLRCIGMRRARFWVGLTNLLYNMFRFVFLKRNKFVPVATAA